MRREARVDDQAGGSRANEEWGRRLRSAARWWADREDIKLSPITLAAEFHKAGGRKVTRQTMSRWLEGAEPASFSDVQALAALLDQPAGWLAYGEGEPRIHAARAPREATGTHHDDQEDVRTPPRGRREG